MLKPLQAWLAIQVSADSISFRIGSLVVALRKCGCEHVSLNVNWTILLIKTSSALEAETFLLRNESHTHRLFRLMADEAHWLPWQIQFIHLCLAQAPCKQPLMLTVHLESVCTWRHGGHIGVPKHWNGGHIGVLNESYGTWTLFSFKSFLLF